jgi:hypothetical protein
MSVLILSLVLLFVALSLQVTYEVNKEGFLTYVVYGPDPWFARRAWHRRYWYGPCPGPWCPYA